MKHLKTYIKNRNAGMEKYCCHCIVIARFLIDDFCDFDVQFNPTSVEAVTNNLAEIYLFEVL